MRPEDFDYDLPTVKIAQRPLSRRDDSRLLVINRASGQYEDRLFADFPTILNGDELLVLNNARVIPARLFGRRVHEHAAEESGSADSFASPNVEILLSRQLDPTTWEVLARPAKKIRLGQTVLFGAGELQAEVVATGKLSLRTLRFASGDARSISEHLDRLGHMPLPPYIDRPDELSDRERYQTIFAKQPGAIAAPTAGLHFAPDTLEKIRARGIEICELTLNVGLGTFRPIRSETLEAHEMHSESYEIPAKTAHQIQVAHSARRPILAIGTTVVRALEDAARRAAESRSRRLVDLGKSEARILIAPGFPFRVVDALLTNFHLPRSTLLALVCAFAGRENILAAYRHAVQADYRFYSYGDCMLIRYPS
ncbi:MAG TPA: tRNA preQ1(34) S-adenosylmethionine ribosyltransferase-isomerase QueA [Candidatus Dormibacteraeota bacterium]|nr:tRNA preQ1(34) S-adenosylmethionine ribosyltransferase-isomerase QueA [Candidatus Dormibacteraeota bacterium]